MVTCTACNCGLGRSAPPARQNRPSPRASPTNGSGGRRAARAAVRGAKWRTVWGVTAHRPIGAAVTRTGRPPVDTGCHQPLTLAPTGPTDPANYQSPAAKCICRVGFQSGFDFTGKEAWLSCVIILIQRYAPSLNDVAWLRTSSYTCKQMTYGIMIADTVIKKVQPKLLLDSN